MRRVACLFAFPLALLAHPQQPVAQGQIAQDPEKAALEGQVLNAATSELLRKANLTLRRNVAALATRRGQQPEATTSIIVASDAAGSPLPTWTPAIISSLRAIGFADIVRQSRQRPQGRAHPARARRSQDQPHREDDALRRHRRPAPR
jgi:hypothetical protein